MSSTCAMRSSYVVARGERARGERGPCVAAWLRITRRTWPTPPANYTIHLVPILRRLYYTALPPWLAAPARGPTFPRFPFIAAHDERFKSRGSAAASDNFRFIRPAGNKTVKKPPRALFQPSDCYFSTCYMENNCDNDEY